MAKARKNQGEIRIRILCTIERICSLRQFQKTPELDSGPASGLEFLT
jgi:hypothetical protein